MKPNNKTTLLVAITLSLILITGKFSSPAWAYAQQQKGTAGQIGEDSSYPIPEPTCDWFEEFDIPEDQVMNCGENTDPSEFSVKITCEDGRVSIVPTPQHPQFTPDEEMECKTVSADRGGGYTVQCCASEPSASGSYACYDFYLEGGFGAGYSGGGYANVKTPYGPYPPTPLCTFDEAENKPAKKSLSQQE